MVVQWAEHQMCNQTVCSTLSALHYMQYGQAELTFAFKLTCGFKLCLVPTTLALIHDC